MQLIWYAALCAAAYHINCIVGRSGRSTFGHIRGFGVDQHVRALLTERHELRRRRILPVIPRRGTPNIEGLGTLRYVVEQTFALLHQFKRLAVRWERRTELHNAFISLACSLICWRRLKKAQS